MNILEVNGLVKRFGNRTAVDQVGFSIAEGESFGLLGPNGAGKSTTIGMISGLLPPCEGDVHVAGMSVRERPMDTRKAMGVVPQDIALYPTLTARENLVFWGQMYGISGQALRDAVNHALKVVGLTDRADDRIQTYSGGMKRRINIAVGLLHRPKLLVLDEPTVGIDPQSRHHILETVKALNEQGMSVLYTSHYMEEVEFLCHRVAIMDLGKVMAVGTLDELRMIVGDQDTIVIKAQGVEKCADQALDGVEGVSGYVVERGRIRVNAPHGRRVLASIIMALNENGVHIDSVEVQEPNLENVFLHLTGKSLRD